MKHINIFFIVIKLKENSIFLITVQTKKKKDEYLFEIKTEDKNEFSIIIVIYLYIYLYFLLSFHIFRNFNVMGLKIKFYTFEIYV